MAAVTLQRHLLRATVMLDGVLQIVLLDLVLIAVQIMELVDWMCSHHSVIVSLVGVD